MSGLETHCPHCGQFVPCKACRECGYHVGHMSSCFEGQIARAKLLGTHHVLAVQLHKLFCHYNHADDCAWFYELGENGAAEWGRYAHKRWLEKASQVYDMVKEGRNQC